ncbi:MAG: DNA repair protein RecO [Planctomycetota bacterium]|nr:MAG: DNA repair protein RecO [Planctomycetota bacterium]
MPRIDDDALVLRRLDYSETSQVLVLLTRRHGKVRVLAKGVRRGTKTRFAPGIDLLEFGHVGLTARADRGAGLATLTEWKPTRPLGPLRDDLLRLYAAQYLAEILAALTEDWDPHPGLFERIEQTFERLATAADPLPSLVRAQLAVLDSVGSRPRFDACVACGREETLTHLSSFEGGMLCRNCEPSYAEKWEVSACALRFLRALLAQRVDPGTGPHDSRETGPSEAPGVSRREGLDAFPVLNYHIAHLMGRRPRVADLLLTAARPLR